MAWNHIETGTIGVLPLDLYEMDRDFMIRVDGMELVNSRSHGSETALARIAHAAVADASNILVGGLGIGFTLAAMREEFGGAVELTVVEKSGDVLEWFNGYFQKRFFSSLNMARTWFVLNDVADFIAAPGPPYSIIVLDVDNGPEAVCGESNCALYSSSGLLLIRQRLSPGGALLVWSGFESPDFEERAAGAGFAVEAIAVATSHEFHKHWIYVCKIR